MRVARLGFSQQAAPTTRLGEGRCTRDALAGYRIAKWKAFALRRPPDSGSRQAYLKEVDWLQLGEITGFRYRSTSILLCIATYAYVTRRLYHPFKKLSATSGIADMLEPC